jgi:hypothetical protein
MPGLQVSQIIIADGGGLADAHTQFGRVQVTVNSDDMLRIGVHARAIIQVGRSCGPCIPLSAVL